MDESVCEWKRELDKGWMDVVKIPFLLREYVQGFQLREEIGLNREVARDRERWGLLLFDGFTIEGVRKEKERLTAAILVFIFSSVSGSYLLLP